MLEKLIINYINHNLIIFLVMLFYNFSFCQELTEKYIKTTEYVDTKKRRDLFYNSDMKLVKEIYYSDDYQKIINIVNYTADGKVERFQGFKEYPKIYIDVDYLKGTYSVPSDELYLRFNNNYQFNGVQKSEKIVVNYFENKRNGRLIQTDSAVFGSKTIINKKADIKILLKFNILKFYNEVGSQDNYKLFRGLILNFKNDLLEGEQRGFYVNGKVKLNSFFSQGKIKSYMALDKEGALQTKIIADSNCVVKSPYILNGVLNENAANIYFKNDELNSVGLIQRRDDFEFEGGGWNNYRLYDYSSSSESLRWISDTSHISVRGKKVITNEDGTKAYSNFFDQNSLNRLDLKSEFDKNKLIIEYNNPNILRVLMYIPMFYIKTYNFNKNDQTELISVEMN